MKKSAQQWLKIAQSDYKDSLYLFKAARHPNAVYIICQAIEKALKAAQIERKNQTPRKIHHLKQLAKATGLPFSEDQYVFLDNLTKDCNRVRYPDYQSTYYNTKAKVEPIINQGKNIYQWILRQLKSH